MAFRERILEMALRERTVSKKFQAKDIIGKGVHLQALPTDVIGNEKAIKRNKWRPLRLDWCPSQIKSRGQKPLRICWPYTNGTKGRWTTSTIQLFGSRSADLQREENLNKIGIDDVISSWRSCWNELER
eukprot:gnl/MRDRNA2_/MRDRNA2_66360_c0_seq1.p1 gnl/MRDRNA2_/MRDRNA2_66360_c0~~gnl/MRDRNA2_/MRDRNA2_66360_c0_seq1.p1  ORF type:complete len:129 (-),score=6.46 gnl/MRDRNA2_/MRDRNA2_66360_c0_seq1:174-560(-)